MVVFLHHCILLCMNPRLHYLRGRKVSAILEIDDLFRSFCSETMSSKEIKSRLKAAKAAVEEKDFEKALKQCQVSVHQHATATASRRDVTIMSEHHLELLHAHVQILFQVDAQNYNGQVFAGLACLQLGKHQESKAYYRSAITRQPDGPLAWKVLNGPYA